MAVAMVPEHDNFEEMTRLELRCRIARAVGCKTYPPSRLDKGTLNSIYAYAEGEFSHDPRTDGDSTDPGWESRKAVFVDVAIAVGIADPEEGWDGPIEHLPDEFRHHELVTIALYLDENPDQREWVREGM
jgi:hypothetical protein